MKNFYHIVIISGVILAGMLYGWKFERLTETQLIQMSYIWFPFIFFGLFGHLGLHKGKNSILFAILGAFLGTALLVLFFEVVFPLL